jgi:hypothetical protein
MNNRLLLVIFIVGTALFLGACNAGGEPNLDLGNGPAEMPKWQSRPEFQVILDNLTEDLECPGFYFDEGMFYAEWAAWEAQNPQGYEYTATFHAGPFHSYQAFVTVSSGEEPEFEMTPLSQRYHIGEERVINKPRISELYSQIENTVAVYKEKVQNGEYTTIFIGVRYNKT